MERCCWIECSAREIDDVDSACHLPGLALSLCASLAGWPELLFLPESELPLHPFTHHIVIAHGPSTSAIRKCEGCLAESPMKIYCLITVVTLACQCTAVTWCPSNNHQGTEEYSRPRSMTTHYMLSTCIIDRKSMHLPSTPGLAGTERDTFISSDVSYWSCRFL